MTQKVKIKFTAKVRTSKWTERFNSFEEFGAAWPDLIELFYRNPDSYPTKLVYRNKKVPFTFTVVIKEKK